jgi:hypothetical protein
LDMVIIEKLLRNIIILNYGQNLWLESWIDNVVSTS